MSDSEPRTIRIHLNGSVEVLQWDGAWQPFSGLVINCAVSEHDKIVNDLNSRWMGLLERGCS